MFRATGSTGCSNGAAAFIFFRVRTVDAQNRCCETLSVGGPFIGAGETDPGGGVAVFKRYDKYI